MYYLIMMLKTLILMTVVFVAYCALQYILRNKYPSENKLLDKVYVKSLLVHVNSKIESKAGSNSDYSIEDIHFFDKNILLTERNIINELVEIYK